jgi:hypothetical protein
MRETWVTRGVMKRMKNERERVDDDQRRYRCQAKELGSNSQSRRAHYLLLGRLGLQEE